MYNDNSTSTKGLMFLSMFTPQQIEQITAAIMRHGPATTSAAYELTQRHGNVPPMFSMVPSERLDADEVLGLILGLRAEVVHLLSRQPSRDEYASILQSMGVPSSMAFNEAESVLTPDGDMRGFILNALSWLPAFPFEVGKNVAAAGAGMLQSIVPEAWMNRANDRLYEIYRLGLAVRRLSQRALLSRVEIATEQGVVKNLNPALSPNMDPSNPAARATAMTMAESMLGMLVGSTLGSALLRRFGLPGMIAGQLLGGLGGTAAADALTGGGSAAPALPGTVAPPALPPGGDYQGPEYGDFAGGFTIPADVRVEAGEALSEFLNSAGDWEAGGWTSVLRKGSRLLKPLAAKLAPVAGAAVGAVLGGPLGAKVGSGLGSAMGDVLGSGHDASFTPDERAAISATAATSRALRSEGPDALARLLRARGTSTTIGDLLAAMR